MKVPAYNQWINPRWILNPMVLWENGGNVGDTASLEEAGHWGHP